MTTKSYVDIKECDVSYEVGSKVFLSTSNIESKTLNVRKSLPQWIDPFDIIKRVGIIVYCLKMPEFIGIHNVFHVYLLKPYKANGKGKPPSPPFIQNYDLPYELERILQHEVKESCSRPIKSYLIKWLSYGLEHNNSWELGSNLRHNILEKIVIM